MLSGLLLVITLPLRAIAGVSQGTILVNDLNLRSGPGIKYPVIARLPKGSRVIIEFEQEGWLRVKYAGRKGYIRGLPGYIKVQQNRSQGRKIHLKATQQEAEDMEQQLEISRLRLKQIASREKELVKRIYTAERSLHRVRRQVRLLRRQLAKMEKEIAAAENRKLVLESRVDETARYVGARLVAWYKLSWVGTAQLFAGADSLFDLVVRRRGLETILETDEHLLQGLIRDQAEVEKLLESLNAKQKEKSHLQRELAEKVDSLRSEMKRRETLLAKVRNEKTAALAKLAVLQQAAEELDRTLAALPKPEAKGIGSNGNAAGRNFEHLQGLLSMPVKGKIISFFGPYRDTRLNVINFRNGIDIEADPGEPVKAVAKGYTMFADWVAGYGNLLIIDHGNHFYTVYAHLEEMFKAKGEAVDRGEVIATVGDSGALMEPGLHFEIRHRDKPLDPMDWLKH